MCCLNAADEMALSVITVNVNGLRDAVKRAGVMQWLHALPAPVDIVCLQEVHCTSVEECTRWFSSTGLLCVVSSGSVHSCGCVVLFRPRLSLVGSWSDADGRFVQCEFSFQVKIFVSRVFMRPIGTLLVTLSFPMLRYASILQSLLCFAVILMQFLTVFWTELARILLTLPVRAQLRFHVFFRLVVFLTSGATYIRPPTVSLGLGGMASLLPVLISSVFLFLGLLLSPPVISFLSRFLITAQFTYPFLSVMLLPRVQGSGS